MSADVKTYDIGLGRYDVTVSVGPSFQTRRQESVAMMSDLLHAFPQAFPVIADLYIGNSDIPGSKEMAKRFKAMLPPQVQELEGGNAEADLQKCQAQLQQASQQMQLLQQHLQQAMEDIKTQKVQADAKVAIAKIDQATKIAVAEITTKAQDARARQDMEFKTEQIHHQTAHDAATQAVEHSHEHSIASKQAAIASAQADQGHQQDLETQAGQQGHEQSMAEQAQSSQE